MRRAPALAVRLSRPDPDAFLGAAYALTAVAYVALDRKGATWTATLRPKEPGGDLRAAFEREYAAQRLRWQVARANVPVRAELLRRMRALAEGSPERPGQAREALSAEAAAETARLLAEARSAPRDPLGIATVFSELRKAPEARCRR